MRRFRSRIGIIEAPAWILGISAVIAGLLEPGYDLVVLGVIWIFCAVAIHLELRRNIVEKDGQKTDPRDRGRTSVR